uniref:Uncharacterized protein n=1 Tax=Oryza brachyantha TaxID=4533 RepID=J3L9T6_ORYBR
MLIVSASSKANRLEALVGSLPLPSSGQCSSTYINRSYFGFFNHQIRKIPSLTVCYFSITICHH